MGYRRLFIMRKDLNMSVGKLLAQVGHCAEAYWTKGMAMSAKRSQYDDTYMAVAVIDKSVFEEYVCGKFTKTVLQAENKKHLLKAKKELDKMGFVEGEDYGLIYDACLTELTPEEENGTTLTGLWTCPMPDDEARKVSRAFHLYE